MLHLDTGVSALIGSIGSSVVSATKAAEAKEEVRRQRAPFDNANFIKSIADAVYFIQLDGEPIHLECDKTIMPNQFVHQMSSLKAIGPIGSRYVNERDRFAVHQAIMRDALKQNFERILIVEPGVELVHLPTRPFVLEKDQPCILVLGACFELNMEFDPSPRDSRLQFGKAQEIHAVVVQKEFMAKMKNFDYDLLHMSMDEIYNRQHKVLAAVPAPFEKTQTDIIDRINIKSNNMYRNYCTWPLCVALSILLVIFLIWILM